jgi:hypothetical protein
MCEAAEFFVMAICTLCLRIQWGGKGCHEQMASYTKAQIVQ